MARSWKIVLALFVVAGLAQACTAQDPSLVGKMALPVDFPLMPGDEALWPTLTLEQQQRAIQYLQDGSTIQSSLRGEY